MISTTQHGASGRFWIQLAAVGAGAVAVALVLGSVAAMSQEKGAAASPPSAPARAAQMRMDGELTTIPVRGGISMLQMAAAGNVAVSVGPDGVFVIDDQFAPMVPKIRAAIGKLTNQPIRWLANTHWHADHTGGNADFGRAGQIIVAHDNVRKRMSKPFFSEFFRSNTPASPPEALPVVSFSDRMTFHFNGDVIRVRHIANAHTDGDAVYQFERANVLHTGDIFVLYGYPFIDLSSGGSINGMIAACDTILAMIGDDTIVIPGHGPLSNKARVREFRAMLTTARDRVDALRKSGKTAEEAMAAKPLADLDAEWGKGFVKPDQFVDTVYRSLAAG